MAIRKNVGLEEEPGGRAEPEPEGKGGPSTPALGAAGFQLPFGARITEGRVLGAPPKLPARTVQPVDIAKVRPVFAEVVAGLIPPIPIQKTTTQLAKGAISQLKGAAPALVTEAINTIRNKGVAPSQLMGHLERKVRVGEVLNKLAKDWSTETLADFAETFSMEKDRLGVMDSIVSVAILTDDDLEQELRAENTPETTPGDLLENRRIVWQSEEPGTVLNWPYVVLIAVEYRDVAKAEDVVRSILGELVTFQGFRIPQAVAQRL